MARARHHNDGMDCYICLLNTGGVQWRWQCGHTSHWNCVRQNLPMPCPGCRHPWEEGGDGGRLLRFRRLHDVGPYTPPLERSRPRHRLRGMPRDVMPLCCRHVGRPPNFLPEETRQMPWAVVDGHDEWACSSCGKGIFGTNLILLVVQHLCAHFMAP